MTPQIIDRIIANLNAIKEKKAMQKPTIAYNGWIDVPETLYDKYYSKYTLYQIADMRIKPKENNND